MSIRVNPLIIRDVQSRVRCLLNPLHVHPKQQQPTVRRNWHLRDPLHNFTRFSFFLFFFFGNYRQNIFIDFFSLILTHFTTTRTFQVLFAPRDNNLISVAKLFTFFHFFFFLGSEKISQVFSFFFTLCAPSTFFTSNVFGIFCVTDIETAKMKEQPPISQTDSWISHETSFSHKTFWSRCALPTMLCNCWDTFAAAREFRFFGESERFNSRE